MLKTLQISIRKMKLHTECKRYSSLITGTEKLQCYCLLQFSRTYKVFPRKKLDVTKIFTERNFITPLRAMNEYLLKPTDLEELRKIQRRSPYEESPPINVYLRKDVELKAIEVWGSMEALQRELKKKRELELKNKDDILNVKKILKDYSRSTEVKEEAKKREAILRGSGRVVMTAVMINGANFAFKLITWLYTGSHSMFAEAIHSLADTCNQIILAFGIRKSIQRPDVDHPYGYHNMRYVASLISGVGIFCFGTGISIYHGIMGIFFPEVIESLYWAFFILGGSLISEGGTLLIAFNEVKKNARIEGLSILEYVLRSRDPSLNVVLLEDLAAVIGVIIAGSCMGLTSYMGNPIYDAAGSLLVGGLLGTVASFIIYTNIAALVGRSIPADTMLQINKELENDVMIRALHDVKATDMGNNFVRYKAEVDFDGRELSRSYLDSQDLEMLLNEMQKVKTIEEVEAFMLRHGENIVDMLGGEVDRIEKGLKKRHPEVRHVDLEVL
ncbi:proton-coupled zinc antiporter SLC30A9, mitochondrial [Centruroides vittatus]|uniref:proton-coupled zinc antiporter SLC30A9, mitochondrial n=1 Tax=Centruroides vittatus TaxID=120091 RepID=UPI00350FE6A5